MVNILPAVDNTLNDPFMENYFIVVVLKQQTFPGKSYFVDLYIIISFILRGYLHRVLAQIVAVLASCSTSCVTT